MISKKKPCFKLFSEVFCILDKELPSDVSADASFIKYLFGIESISDREHLNEILTKFITYIKENNISMMYIQLLIFFYFQKRPKMLNFFRFFL